MTLQNRRRGDRRKPQVTSNQTGRQSTGAGRRPGRVNRRGGGFGIGGGLLSPLSAQPGVVGRTGAVTPVAELEPVLLAGSTISRATLHNYDEIKRKDIREGDRVVIEKGGDVIPKIVLVVLSERNKKSKPVKPPAECPVCKSPLFNPPDEVAYYCENTECPAQVKEIIKHFASRTAMVIEGLGEALIDIFVVFSVTLLS